MKVGHDASGSVALEEMGQHASAAGLSGRGIPLVEVRGRVLRGFDAEWMERALED